MTTADVHDSKAAPALLETFMDQPGRLLKLVWVDSAYQGAALAKAFARHGVRIEVVRRSAGQRECVVLARRWVVERTLSWLSRSRRLNRDHDRRLDQMVWWAAGCPPAGGGVLRIRTISRLGVDVRIGIGPSNTIAATASGQVPLPGGVLAIASEDVTGWLGPLPRYRPRPCSACWAGRPGVWPPTGPAALTPAPSSPAPCPPRRACTRFDEHTLDGAAVRAALLDLVVRLGTRLRGRSQAARALALTLKFAGGSSWDKTRCLTAPGGPAALPR
ncbi:transposase [Streptomyces canus]|uniref:transposase n=1 Tax=Streptomyces canus TaxID=58343 RepID=UPI002E2C22C7|nr:transposase [Streptomyces canus]